MESQGALPPWCLNVARGFARRPSISVGMLPGWTLVAVSLCIAGCGGGSSSPTTAPSSVTPQVPTVYEPGNGVSLPTVIRDVKPTYTLEAARARIHGTVLVAAVVLLDGTVCDVTVLRSLDTTFGLDAQAVKAAKQWLFNPGTKDGQAVAVRVTIEFTFTLT